MNIIKLAEQFNKFAEIYSIIAKFAEYSHDKKDINEALDELAGLINISDIKTQADKEEKLKTLTHAYRKYVMMYHPDRHIRSTDDEKDVLNKEFNIITQLYNSIKQQIEDKAIGPAKTEERKDKKDKSFKKGFYVSVTENEETYESVSGVSIDAAMKNIEVLIKKTFDLKDEAFKDKIHLSLLEHGIFRQLGSIYFKRKLYSFNYDIRFVFSPSPKHDSLNLSYKMVDWEKAKKHLYKIYGNNNEKESDDVGEDFYEGNF